MIPFAYILFELPFKATCIQKLYIGATTYLKQLKSKHYVTQGLNFQSNSTNGHLALNKEKFEESHLFIADIQHCLES